MKPASLPRRLGAILYDSLLLLALLFLATVPFIAVRGGQPVSNQHDIAIRRLLNAEQLASGLEGVLDVGEMRKYLQFTYILAAHINF